MGPVTPLLAVVETWRKMDQEVEFVWVGTKNGPEREVVTETGMRFLYLPVVRLPRYVSLEWFLLPLRSILTIVKSIMILRYEKPDVIASAGGFTGVPLIIIGKIFGIPSWVHQQDAHPLLANRISSPFATMITTAWKESKKTFAKDKTTWIGNPVRPSMLHGKKDAAYKIFHLNLDKPTVLVFGGGSGAMWLNQMMQEVADWLAKEANVIHITGKGKMTDRLKSMGKRYFAVEFLTDEMANALAAADIVVCRAGMGTITELAALKKAAVLVPIPGAVAQQKNALHVKKAKAGIVLDQRKTSVGDLKKAIQDLLSDKAIRKEYGKSMHELLPTDVAEEIVGRLQKL